ncbi:integrating conjugative element protein [Pseudomonas sp. P105]|uniref:integrating conjugative element protein n=1 Tax=Pseudomonas sp. P105 TaxID=3049542 RepID=UPI0029342087|nr:integrating conjugative element protein [Pseudomonas sp. P105]WNZ76393.1 integrating conjugative element protein [Pseudomonas sp. P105]
MKSACAWALAFWVLNCHGVNAEDLSPSFAEARYSEEDMLPVRSPALSPGVVQRRTLDATGLPAFFLVGDDARSRVWLKQRRLLLTKLKAAGLVVNVESKTSLEDLRRIGQGLTLFPVSADDLAHRLNLRHYPVLITASSVEQ